MSPERYPAGVDPEAEAPYRPSEYELKLLERFLKSYPDVTTSQQAIAKYQHLEQVALGVASEPYARESRDRVSMAWRAAIVLQYFETNGLDIATELAAREPSEE